jgi:hypothetical protein
MTLVYSLIDRLPGFSSSFYCKECAMKSMYLDESLFDYLAGEDFETLVLENPGDVVTCSKCQRKMEV